MGETKSHKILGFYSINSTGKLNINFESHSEDKRYWNYELIIPTDSLNSSVSKRIHDFNNQHIYWQYIEDNY